MSTTKSERTTQYILETVAPVFNKHGFVGTSMSDLTEATGLTKGALYGNFKGGKEQLALEVFNFTVRKIMWKMADQVNAKTTAREKLFAITEFYRNYYQRYMEHMGGCAILNMGVDANHLNPALFERVKAVISKLKQNLATILQAGIDSGEFRQDLDADQIGSRLFAMIQGGIFLTNTFQEPSHLFDMMNQIDQMVERDFMN
ncbi:MAG: TetR/AcrR family transcriptional regulator [Bacteroidia bacterium]|nr:TetR/AcrR family transcriptional regulator [Bacteroidia bacterium]